MVPAVEILIANPVVKNLIAIGEERKIPDVVRTSAAEGMRDMTTAFAMLVKDDIVLQKVALEMSPNPERLRMELRGITMAAGQIIG